MTNRLELPFWKLPALYNPHTREMLNRICAPIDTAIEGETVGVQFKLYTIDYAIDAEPIKYVYKLSDNPNRLINKYLPQIHGEEIDTIAKHLLLAQSIGLFTHGLQTAACTVDPSWNPQSDPLYLMALPNFALIYQHNYDGNALQADTIDQHVVNRSMLAVQTWQPETAHEKIEELRLQQRMLDIINETVPMPCEEPLVLPCAGPAALESTLVI